MHQVQNVPVCQQFTCSFLTCRCVFMACIAHVAFFGDLSPQPSSFFWVATSYFYFVLPLVSSEACVLCLSSVVCLLILSVFLFVFSTIKYILFMTSGLKCDGS